MAATTPARTGFNLALTHTTVQPPIALAAQRLRRRRQRPRPPATCDRPGGRRRHQRQPGQRRQEHPAERGRSTWRWL